MPLDDSEIEQAVEWLRNSAAKELMEIPFFYPLFLLLFLTAGILLFFMLGIAVCLTMNVDYRSAMYSICFGYPIMMFLFFCLYSKKFGR